MNTDPAFIAIMPPAPETSQRWYSMYCRVCGVEEMMTATADDPRLIAHRDDHNRRHHAPAEPPSSENAYTGIPLSEVIRSEQGEPSDAQVYDAEAAFWAHKERTGIFKGAMRAAVLAAGGVRNPGTDWYDTHCPTCDAPEPWHTATCAVVHLVEPKGEPSDAQVTAALHAYQGQSTRVEAMRAALRAAGGVR